MGRRGGRKKSSSATTPGRSPASRKVGGESSVLGPDEDLEDQDAFYTPAEKYMDDRAKEEGVIALSDGSEEDEEQDGGMKDQAVFDLDVSDEEEEEGGESEGDYSSEDPDSEEDILSMLPEHLRKAAMEAEDGDDGLNDGSEGEDADNVEKGLGWGRKKSAYYDADTADLEIGQSFEDAEEEERAALEQQRAAVARLSEGDFADMDEDSDGDSDSDIDGIGRGKRQETTSKLEQKKFSSEGMSSEQRMDLLLNEAPELPRVLSTLRLDLKELVDCIDPLCKAVTSDLGASEDGLIYLRAKRQLLLANVVNSIFYLLLRGTGARGLKHHPVMERLVQLRKIAAKLEPVDSSLAPQVELLVQALEDGIDLHPSIANDEGDSIIGDEHVPADGPSGEESYDEDNGDGDDNRPVDEAALDAEEARFANAAEDMGLTARKPTGDFGDDEAAYERVHAKHKFSINPLQAAANRVTQKVKRKGRTADGGDEDVPYVERRRADRRPAPEFDENTSAADYTAPQLDPGSDSDADPEAAEYLDQIAAEKQAKSAAKKAKYEPAPRIAGELEEELDLERERLEGKKGKRGVSYEIMKNRGLTPHKNKLNRNPRVKKRMAFRKAVIRRKGQVRDVREGEAGQYAGEATGIRKAVTKGRKFT
jgi:U3 small nucleolar RNA-associated protein 3